MSDIIKVLLQAEIHPDSVKNIREQVQGLENKISTKPIKVKVDADTKASEKFKDMNLELQKLGKFDLSNTPLVKGMEVVGYSVKEAKDGTVKFTQSLNDGKNKIVTYSGEINKASNNYEILGKSTRQATRDNQTFVKELGIAIKRTVEWSLAVGGYYKIIREVKEGIQFINEADKSLNQIQMITGMTAKEVSGLAVEYADLGKQMGITTNEILKGSVEWFRQGKTMAETADLMKASIMEAKLAGIDTASATEYLTSTLNGFKLEASDAIDVVSKMVAIDNIAATSVEELSVALQRSATSAQQAGVEIDTLLSYIGTVSSVSRRSASSIGESFKTMFARMQDIKQGKLDEDGMGLSDVENTLNRIGIAVRSNEDNFRDLDDIIANIAEKWDSLDQVTQSSIAKSIAGVRQRENFLILMANYQTSLKLEEESLNSAGLAQERYAIYLESTEAKLAQLQATADKMWLNFLDSSTIKTGIDLMADLIGGIDQLINHTESLGVALVVLAGAFIMAYKAMGKLTLAEYIAKYAALTTSTNILTVAQTGLAGAVGLVKTAFAFLFTTPLGWITLAIGGVLALTNHLRKQREEVEKLTTTYNDYSNSLATMDIEGQKKALNEITEYQNKLNKLMEERDKLGERRGLTPNSDALFSVKDNEINDLIEQIKSLGFEVDTTTGKIKDLDTLNKNIKLDEKINAISKLLDSQVRENENLTSLIDNYTTLSQVENKSEEQKKAMTGIVQELKGKYDDLIVVLDDEGNMQITNIGILEDKKTALLKEKDALISSAKDKITALVDETTVVFNNTKTTIGAIRDRISAYNAEIEVINRRNRAAAGALSDSKTAELEVGAFKKHRRNDIPGAVEYVATYVDPLIESLFGKYSSGGGAYIPSATNTGGSSSTSKSSAKDQYSAVANRYEAINQQLDKNNVLLAKNKTLQELAGDDTAKKIELMKEEIKLNEDRQKLLNQLNNERRDRAKELQKELSDIFNFEGSWDDNSMVITNLNDIEGKGKDIKEKYDEILSIIKDLPNASQDWWNIQNNNKNLIIDINKLLEQQKELERTEWIEKENDLYNKQQQRLSALEQIQERIVQIIRKRGEEELKVLDVAYQKDMEQLDERHNKRKEQYAEELDLFRKNIQTQIELLEGQYAEEDYLKDLQKERDKATELQKQIDVLSLDTSLTANNQVIELRKQLADQNNKIADMQQKRERDLVKKSLEDQLKEKEDQVKEIEDIADDQYKNDKKRLEEDYRIAKEYHERKYSDEKVYSEARQAILDGEVEVAKGRFVELEDAFKDFEDEFGKGMGILGDVIKNDFIKQLELAQKAIEEMDYKAKNLRVQYDSDYQPTDKELGKNKDKSSNSGIYMSSSDFNKYLNYKLIYDMAKNAGNKASMDAARDGAQAIRMKYEIASDKYSYDDLKNRSYKDVKFKHGGKLTQTGTMLAEVHGTQTTPEWIFNDSQLKSIVRDVTLSAINVALPKIPNISGVGNSSSNQYQILFDVKGNLDKSIMPDIQRMITATIEKVEFNKEKGYKKIGLTRPV